MIIGNENRIGDVCLNVLRHLRMKKENDVQQEANFLGEYRENFMSVVNGASLNKKELQ